MLEIITRYFFISLSCIYCANKILKISLTPKLRYLTPLLYSIISSGIIAFFTSNDFLIKAFVLFLLIFLYNTVITKIRVSTALTTALLCTSLSYIFLTLSCFCVAIIAIHICPTTSDLLSFPYILLTGVLQLLSQYALFKNKRLHTGVSFILKKTPHKFTSAIYPLLIIMVFIIAKQYNPSSLNTHTLILLTLTTLSFLLLYWWKRKITQVYLEKLRLEEREDLYHKLALKDAEIEKLRTDNEQLGRIIHKDNKLIPAMEYAVRNYLYELNKTENTLSTFSSQQVVNKLLYLQQHGETLINSLKQMTAERKGILQTYETNDTCMTQTEILSIDAIIQYMGKRATQKKIQYKVKLDPNIKLNLLDHVEEPDILRLLSDLIENAIIAVTHSDNHTKKILVHLGLSYEHLFFDIYDSGVPFTIEAYRNLGKQPYTTYADSGGSGIGLTDIWNLKRKYKASLQIYEYPAENTGYTKKIRILFDRKNHFLIQTYRMKEINSAIIRNDLHVFPLNQHTLTENREDIFPK